MNIPESLKIEDNFEQMAVDALSDVSLSGVKARETGEITDQDIQVIFENQGNLDDAVLQIGNYRKYTAYEGNIGFIVATNRAKIRNHSDKLAKVRYVMMPESEYFQNEYYQILEIKELNASTDIDEANNSDITSMDFSIKYLILF